MFSVHGIRCLRQITCFLEQRPVVTQNLSPNILRVPGDLSLNASRPSVRLAKLTNSVNDVGVQHAFGVNFSESPRLSRDDIKLNRKIRSLRTVEEQLKLYESVKNSADAVHLVMMLYNIAKTVERDGNQRLVLEEEREKSRQGRNGSYMELLDSVERSISSCRPSGLANIIWAMGKLFEREHKLVEACEQRILSCDINRFNDVGLCQIVSGCANLNLKTSEIFENLEKCILSGRLEISAFDHHLLSAVLPSFAKTGNGSVQLFDVFLEEVLSRDFLGFDNRALASFVWSFAKKDFQAKKLFNQVQEEVLRRGAKDLHNSEFIQILWAFGKAEKGSKEFFSFLDSEVLSRGIGRFENVQLVEIVWSFAKSNATQAKVFDVAKDEIFRRTFDGFITHELLLILWSFVSAQRHDEKFIAEIESKLRTSDPKSFDSGDLCQVAWSLAKAGLTDSKMFDIIEAEVFRRATSEFTRKEKCMLMRGFIEAKRGSKQFYQRLVNSFSATDFTNLHEGQILECLWCVYMSNVEAQTLLDTLEKEILNKGIYDSSHKRISLNTLFKKNGKEINGQCEM